MFDFKKLAVPVIQAPMAGGVCTPELVAAVANAGGLGSFGFAYSTAQRIESDLRAARALTAGPVNANFFWFEPVTLPDSQIQTGALQALASMPGLPNGATGDLSLPTAPYFPDLQAQLSPVWAHPPEVLTFHFGIPEARTIDQAHAYGIAVGMTATSINEAIAIERAGADFIVAQGIEAGGHRGLFDIEAADEKLPAVELTRRLVKACRLPIVTAGGLMTGKDIAAALQAGATAVQLGTAFLCCDESGASPAHKRYLLTEGQCGTALTRGFSGRPARGIRNAFIQHMQDKPHLPFPLQNTLTGPMRQWATQTNNGQYQSLWAGTEYARARSMTAAELMQTLKAETREALAQKPIEPNPAT